MARRLAASHPEITGLLAFGSVMRGDAVPGSDLDLLLVMAESDEPFLDRIRRFTPEVTELEVDVLPYTEAELSRMIAEGNALVTSALSEGEWIVGPPETLVGAV